MGAFSKLQLRKGSAAEWTAANPILLQGEPGYETDTKRVKYGDGTTAWNSLLINFHADNLYADATFATLVFGGDADASINKVGAGTLQFGGFSGAVLQIGSDVKLYRSAADVLKLEDTLYTVNAASETMVMDGLNGSDSPRFHLVNDSSGRGANDGTYFGLGNGTHFYFLNYEASNIYFYTGGNEFARFDHSGRTLALVSGVSVELTENGTTDAAAGAANTGRLYVKDNGAGKTQLYVIFNTGAAQLLATQP